MKRKCSAVVGGLLSLCVLTQAFTQAQAQSVQPEGAFASPNITFGGSLGLYLELARVEGWAVALRPRAQAGLSLLGFSTRGSGWDLGMDVLLATPMGPLGQVYAGPSWGYGYDDGVTLFASPAIPREGGALGWTAGWAGECNQQRQPFFDLTLREGSGAKTRSFASLNFGVRVGC